MNVPLNCDACGNRRAPGSFRLCPQCLAERDTVRPKPPRVPGVPVDSGDFAQLILRVKQMDDRLVAVEGELANLRERAEPVPRTITVEHVLTQLYERFDISLDHLKGEIEDYLRAGRRWSRVFIEDRCILSLVFRPRGDHQLYANGCPLL